MCTLANSSEQFVLTDAERNQALDAVLHRDREPSRSAGAAMRQVISSAPFIEGGKIP
jgi:hypothetical protein